MTLISDRELYGCLIRLHILHHACQKPIYGLWLIEELGRHGYKLSPGTLYPLLHKLERGGLLRSASNGVGGRIRRVYKATPNGRRELQTAKKRVKELFGELFESELSSVFGLPGHKQPKKSRRRAGDLN